MVRILAALALVGAAASGVLAQGKKDKLGPGQGIDWQADWDTAVQEATARNVPIMFTVHKDN